MLGFKIFKKAPYVESMVHEKMYAYEKGDYFYGPKEDINSEEVSGELTRKQVVKKRVMIAAICVLAAAFFALAAYLATGGQIKPLPYSEELHTAWGQPLEIVNVILAEQLADRENELLNVSDGVYKISESSKFEGVSFDTYLYFEPNESLLNGFAYVAQYNADPAAASKNIAAIYKRFGMNLEVDALTVALEAPEGYSETLSHDVTDSEMTKVELFNYLEHLENAEYWEGRVGDYLTKHACCYQDVLAKYDPATQMVSLEIRYSVEAQRSERLGE